jgi:methionine-rich copper-binding protein CopC
MKTRLFASSRAAILVALVALVGTFGSLTRASAHASYDHSNPSDKQVLATAPSQLTITFVENILSSPGTFAVVSNGDTEASATPGSVSTTDSKTLVVPLNGGLKAGKYDVFWKSTSADDGGVTFGHFSFFIGNPSSSDVSAATAGVAVAVPDDATDMALSNPSPADACDSDSWCAYCANHPDAAICPKR